MDGGIQVRHATRADTDGHNECSGSAWLPTLGDLPRYLIPCPWPRVWDGLVVPASDPRIKGKVAVARMGSVG